MGVTIGIDASRNRSGGAIAHLKGILEEGDPPSIGISKVHVWGYRSLIEKTPDRPWLIKHLPQDLDNGLLAQVWWQYRYLPKEAVKFKCDLLFNTDAGSVCPFNPSVTLSQDMLSYEPGEMIRFGILSKARIRLEMLKIIQNNSFKRSKGVIFLTEHASKTIQESCGELKSYKIIPHGVGNMFRLPLIKINEDLSEKNEIRLLYVSNAQLYKHQWNVVRAAGLLRAKGFRVNLLLVGGGKGVAQTRLEAEIKRTDPEGTFVKQKGFVSNECIVKYLAESDLFIFASSCENMPVTLLEAMACGLPIACSSRGPMPEVLQDAGVYFDPEKTDQIANAIETLLVNKDLCNKVMQKAKALSREYTWKRCADETFKYLWQKAAIEQHGKD